MSPADQAAFAAPAVVPPAAAEPVVEAPPMADVPTPTDPDPHGLGVALGRLMGGSRRTAKAAALSAASELLPGEVVHMAAAGRFQAFDAVVLLTNSRLIFGNDRQWQPEIVIIDDLAPVAVEGWVERREATLRVNTGSETYVVDRIKDTEIAQQLAAELRAR